MSDEKKQSKPACRETLAAMYVYIDRELDDATRKELGRHLGDCQPCLEAYEFETELKMIIGARCKDEVPDHLYARVRDSLRVELKKMSLDNDGPE